MNTFLESLGFTKNEAQIYLVLVKYGDLSLTEIYRKTNINRVSLYKILPLLKDSGYISEVKKDKRRFYKAENPEKLTIIFEENKKAFQKNIENLKEMYSQKKQKPVITFKDGPKSIDQVLEDIAISLPKGSTFYRYSSRKNDLNKRKKSGLYYKLRDSKNLERKVITSSKKGLRKKPKLDRFVKTIPEEFDFFEDNVTLFIYGDKIAFVDYESNTSFTIESKKIANFQEKIFKLLYKKL